VKRIIQRKITAEKKRIERRLAGAVKVNTAGPLLGAANIQYEIADRTHAIAHGGIGMIDRLVREVGLAKRIDERVHVLKIHKPYHESDHALNIAYNALCGGQTLDDIELRRRDRVYLDALGVAAIPDPTTAADFCRRFGAGAIDQFQKAVNDTRLDVWSRQPASFTEETARIDADGSIVPTGGECKEGMDISYNGIWGYSALVVSLANTREPLWILNRPGNRPSHEGVIPLFDRSIALCREGGFRDILLRGDTDFSLTSEFDRWTDEGVRFVFGYDAKANMVTRADEQPERLYHELSRRAERVIATAPRSRPENVKDRIVKERGFILDGFPRRPEEVRVIESWLKDGNHIDALVHLEASDKELLRRILARGRMDDSEAVFRKRLEIYRQQTRPVLEHFRHRLNVLEAETDGPDIAANYAKVHALIDGLLDRGGPPPAAQAVRAPLARPGEAPGAPIEIKRRLAHGRYEASTPNARASFSLHEGLLKTEISGRDAAGALDADAELSRALGVFGRGVRAVSGAWARETARDAGFTVEFVENGETIFVRPEDVRHDRDGRPWRRTLRKSEKGADWQRYERDGRAIWLIRHVGPDGIAVYEYEGLERPTAGTPAPRRAVFANHGGRLASNVVDDGAVLLDVAAETSAAVEALIPQRP